MRFSEWKVVAHEYFHNWSGNRVTCRDWFQLSLKREGFYRIPRFRVFCRYGLSHRCAEEVSWLRYRPACRKAKTQVHCPPQPASFYGNFQS
ncbi:MAG: M1 family aminopeptidase [Porticoccaceae bacterium]